MFVMLDRSIGTLDVVQLLQTGLHVKSTQNAPRRIALEEHVWFSQWADLFESPFDGQLQDFGERRLDAMDRDGIEVAVLSPTSEDMQNMNGTGHFAKGFDLTGMNASQILDLQIVQARERNDALFEKMNSRRYRGFALLPMSSPAAAAAELARCVERYGFVGALIYGADTSMSKFTGKPNYYDASDYDVLWRKFVELDVPLYMHPRSIPESQYFYDNNDWSFSNEAWGYAEGTAELVINLMMTGVFERYTELKIILGHMGEFLPFWAARMDSVYPTGNVTERLRRNFYITTSGFPDTAALQHVIQVMGVERVMFATDYPYSTTHNMGNWFGHAMSSLALNESEKDMLEFKNAERLLKIGI